MTIYTRYGSEVKVISEVKVGGWITVIRNAGKGQEAEFLVSELKADGGFSEIEQAGKLYRAETMASHWLYLANKAAERGDYALEQRHLAREQKWHDKMNTLLGND